MTDRQEKNLNFYRQWRSKDRTVNDIKSTKGREPNKNGIEIQDIVQSHAKHTGNIPTYRVDKVKPIQNPKKVLSEIRDVEQALATLPPEKRVRHQAQIDKLRLLIEGKKVSLQEKEAQLQSFKQTIARQMPAKDPAVLEKNVKKQIKTKDNKLSKNLLKAGLAAGAAGAAILAAKQAMSSTSKAAKTVHVSSSNLNRPIGAHSSGNLSGLGVNSQPEERSLAANAANNIGAPEKSPGNNIPKKFMPTQQNNAAAAAPANANDAGKPPAGKGGGNGPGGDKPPAKPDAGKGDKPQAGDKPGGGGPKPPQTPKPPKGGGGAAAGAIGGIIGGIAGAIGGAAGSIIGGKDGNNGNNGNNGNPGNIDDLKKKVDELEKELEKQKEAQKKLEEEVKKNKEQIEEQKKQLEEAKKQIEETKKQLAEAVKKLEEAMKKMGKEVEGQIKMIHIMGALGTVGGLAINNWDWIKGNPYNKIVKKDDGSVVLEEHDPKPLGDYLGYGGSKPKETPLSPVSECPSIADSLAEEEAARGFPARSKVAPDEKQLKEEGLPQPIAATIGDKTFTTLNPDTDVDATLQRIDK